MLEHISIGLYNVHDHAIHISGVQKGETSHPRTNVHIAVHAPPELAQRLAKAIAKLPEMLYALKEIAAEWSDPAIPGGGYPGGMKRDYPYITDTYGVQLAKRVLADLNTEGRI